MRRTKRQCMALVVIVAMLATLIGAALPSAAAEPPADSNGFRALSGGVAASFELPQDVRLVRSFGLPAYGLTYERYQQHFGSAEVLGGQMTVYRDASGAVQSVIGAYYSGLVAHNTVRLSPGDAAGIADRDVGPPQEPDQGRVKLMIDPRSGRFFFVVTTGRAEPPENAADVGTRSGTIIVNRWIHWIDAENGQVLNKYDAIANDGRGTGVKGDTKDLDGADNSNGVGADDLTTFHNASDHGATGAHYDLFSKDNRQKTYDARNGSNFAYFTTDSDNLWIQVTSDRKSPGQPALVDAQYYANVTDDYYLTRHGFNWLAFYPSGMQSVAHYSRNYSNAFWNGTYTIFGDGDGTSFRELSGGLDVVAHENSHGVTDATSNLIYQGESGALNESFSDMMGNSAEFFAGEAASSNCVSSSSVGQGHSGCADWWVGEDVYLPSDTVPGFRNMADPREDGDPDHYGERQVGGGDNGGVHTNSGIPNHAYFLAVNGGKNAGCGDSTWRSPGSTHTHTADCGTSVTAIGLEKAESIFFTAFIALPASATMSNARDATVVKAKSLYSGQTNVCTSVVNAWQAVGVTGSQTCGVDNPPAAPTGLTANAGDGTVSLSWNNNTEADLAGYNVYRGTASGGPYTKLNASLVGTNAFVDTTVSNGTTYYYVVTAVDAGSNQSGNSNEAVATPRAAAGVATHVASITMSAQQKGRLWDVTADVTIVDQNGIAVSGAVASVRWTLNDPAGVPFKTDSRSTNSSGTATFKSGRVAAPSTVYITVTNVAKAGTTFTATSADVQSIAIP